jgi:outer membrane protein
MTAFLVGAILVCAGPAVPNAQQQPELRLAILDVQRVRRDAAAVKSIRSQLETFGKRYRDETARDEQQLRQQREELTRKQAILAPDAFEAERRALEQKIGAAQGRLQQRQQAINKVRSDAMQQVLNSLQDVVTAIGKERGLTLILNRQTAVFADSGYDITDEVLRRLDSRLPTVALANPG